VAYPTQRRPTKLTYAALFHEKKDTQVLVGADPILRITLSTRFEGNIIIL